MIKDRISRIPTLFDKARVAMTTDAKLLDVLIDVWPDYLDEVATAVLQNAGISIEKQSPQGLAWMMNQAKREVLAVHESWQNQHHRRSGRPRAEITDLVILVAAVKLQRYAYRAPRAECVRRARRFLGNPVSLSVMYKAEASFLRAMGPFYQRHGEAEGTRMAFCFLEAVMYLLLDLKNGSERSMPQSA